MLPVEEAVRRIVESVEAVDTETLALGDGLNRIGAVDVVAPIALPQFSHATVDGVAIRHQDVEKA